MIDEDLMSIDLSIEKEILQQSSFTSDVFNVQEAKSEICSEEEIEISRSLVKTLKSSHITSSDSAQSPFSPEVKNFISDMFSQKFSFDFGDLGVDVINFKDLKMREELGKGGYGKVYRAYFRDSECAVKIVNAETINEKVVKDFIKEIQSLIKIRHIRFLLLLGICIEGPLCIVTELAKGGNLLDAIEKDKFSSEEKLGIALHIAEGINYIHNKRPSIIHRDIKPQNILLDKFNQVKIGDLGLSRSIEQIANSGSLENTQVCQGTIRYMAPELYEEHPVCSPKSDVWAYGCVLYQLFSKLQPWNGLEQLAIQRRLVLKLPFQINSELAGDIHDLILRCCQIEPELRPTFKEIRLSLYQIMGIQPSQLS